jgi:tetratricopeptide (TPR) repeat protein
MARYQGNLVQAQSYLEEVARLNEQFITSFSSAWFQLEQGNLAYDQDDFDRASHFYRESLAFFGAREKESCAACIEGLAAVASAQGQVARAARLWSSAAAIREAIGAPLRPIDRPRQEASLAQLRAQLGEEAFAAAWAEGRALSLEQAIAFALETDLDRPAPLASSGVGE